MQSEPVAAGRRDANVRKDIVTVTIRRLLIAFGAIVALAVAAHGAFWWIVAGELRDGVSAWVEERRAMGWTITHAAPAIDGYPMRVRASIDDPDIAVPGARLGDPVRWRWRSARLRLELRPWNLRDVLFSFAGRHRVHANHGERREQFEAKLGSASGRARLAPDGQLESIVLDVGAVEASRPGTPEIVRVGQVGLTLSMPRRSGEAAAKPEDREPAGPLVSLSATNVVLPKEARYPLGRTVRKFAIDAKLLGDVAFAPTVAQTLAAWRDAGGTVEIRRIEVVWGKFDSSGEGTVALDGALQPIVAMTARIKGYRETVDALVETGHVKGRDAVATKFVLAMVARATPGGSSQLTVPITIQNGMLSAGPARLLRVPTIDWDTGTVELKKSKPN